MKNSQNASRLQSKEKTNIINYFVIIIVVESILQILCMIFTQINIKHIIVDINIITIAITFFVYYLLRKGNELIDKKVK